MTQHEAPLTLAVDGPVAVATLNRPTRFNAIDLALSRALAELPATVDAMPDVRALVLRGAGRSFCGGGDIHAMQAHADDLPAFIDQVIEPFHRAMLGFARSRVPVVAAVQGAAAGGGWSLVLAADAVVAARSARFVVAYPQLGTSTDGGLSFRLQQRLGPQRALHLLLQGGALKADAALQLGLVQAVVDDDALDAAALQQAQAWAALPPQAVRELKALAYAPSIDALQAQLERERAAFGRCARTPDFAQCVQAFSAK